MNIIGRLRICPCLGIGFHIVIGEASHFCCVCWVHAAVVTQFRHAPDADSGKGALSVADLFHLAPDTPDHHYYNYDGDDEDKDDDSHRDEETELSFTGEQRVAIGYPVYVTYNIQICSNSIHA